MKIMNKNAFGDPGPSYPLPAPFSSCCFSLLRLVHLSLSAVDKSKGSPKLTFGRGRTSGEGSEQYILPGPEAPMSSNFVCYSVKLLLKGVG